MESHRRKIQFGSTVTQLERIAAICNEVYPDLLRHLWRMIIPCLKMIKLAKYGKSSSCESFQNGSFFSFFVYLFAKVVWH